MTLHTQIIVSTVNFLNVSIEKLSALYYYTLFTSLLKMDHLQVMFEIAYI